MVRCLFLHIPGERKICLHFGGRTMDLTMSYIPDLFLLALFAIMVFRGMKRGLVRSVLGVARLVLSVVAAIAGGPVVADYLTTRSGGTLSALPATIGGYLLAFAGGYILLTAVTFVLCRLTKLPVISTVDKVLGLALGTVSGLVAVAFLATIMEIALRIAGKDTVVEQSVSLTLVSAIRDRLFQ